MSRLAVIKHWYAKDGAIAPDDFKWLMEQVEIPIDYTESLNETRRKRDEVKGKLEVALKTIKDQKQEIKELKEELDKWLQEFNF